MGNNNRSETNAGAEKRVMTRNSGGSIGRIGTREEAGGFPNNQSKNKRCGWDNV